MGLAAADEEQARSTLDLLDRSEWLRPLAPVQVLQADCRPAMVDLVLPDDTEQLVWRLVLENGTERSGQVGFDRLHLLGERQLDGRALQRRRLNLGVDLPCGYHRLSLEPGRSTMTVVITPGHCWLPSALVDGDRMWGIAVQLYLLRSTANWGIGDFGDLQMLVRLASSQGADVIGLNPLHGMFFGRSRARQPLFAGGDRHRALTLLDATL
jgi:(1->4)-alpha-D-glucan 1-alpha-D-glucosylmutase